MKDTGANKILSPTEQYKLDILKLLNKVEQLDIDGNKGGYIRAVKHLYYKMIKYVPKKVRNYIANLRQDLKKELNEIDQKDLTKEQKKQEKLLIEYEYYDRISEYITKVISYSPIVEEEVTGILETGKNIETLRKLTEIIKTTSNEEILIMDQGEYKHEGSFKD